MFSRRTGWKLSPNRFSDAQREMAAAGREVLDLTISNPTRAGLRYEKESILKSLGDPQTLDYDPQPKGLRCAREAAPHMMQSGWGRIINISGLAARSTGSIIGSMRNVSVAALTKNLADELGPFGINVTCVHPGVTRTEKTAGVIQKRADAAGVSIEEIERRMSESNTIRHLVNSDEIANIVVFLASPKSVGDYRDVIVAGAN